jgi:bacterial/archaeal transporter family-2 protein
VAVLAFSMTGVLGRVQVQRLGEAPWWVWSAGLLLGILMVAQTEGLAAGGAGAMMAATVAGQLVAGLIVDHFGWFDVQRISLNGWRIGGALLVIGGAVLMQRR